MHSASDFARAARGLVVGALLTVAPGATEARADLTLDVAADAAIAASVEEQTTARLLPVGSTAWVAGTNGSGLRVHTAPLLASDVFAVLNNSAPVQVLEGPIALDGSNWYRVSAATLPRSGWVTGDYLAAAPPGPPPAGAPLPAGSTAWVVGVGAAGLRVHSAPLAASQQIETLADGMPVQVLEGPASVGGIAWYRVGSATISGSGWVDGQYLVGRPPTPPSGGAPLAVGSTAWVGGTAGAGLRVHSTPSLSSQQIASLNDGTPVQVLQGPVNADGFAWYQINTAQLAGPGWVVGGALFPTQP
jgi:hypothetical protein